METQAPNQDLKHISIKERHQVKLQFFRLYEKYGNVARCARELGIPLRTATTWVRDYKANGNNVSKEKRHGRATGSGRTLTPEQEKRLMSLIVDNTPCSTSSSSLSGTPRP